MCHDVKVLVTGADGFIGHHLVTFRLATLGQLPPGHT
jgi:nucleoside-diphosphate-sugar epimerase